MTWQAYRLVYRALAPVHIGWHTLGYIKLTRPYIPGRAIWGAVTANLTRAFGERGTGDYRKFGELLRKDVLTSYFFPALDTESPLLPHFTEKGIFFGNGREHTRDEFERLFIGSFGQTAILPENNSAEDESLHESEFISPAIHEGGISKPVSFVGYIFIKENASLDGQEVGWNNGEIRLDTACRELSVGGDIKYGWGRLALANDPIYDGVSTTVFGNDLIEIENRPAIKVPVNSPLPAHLIVESGYQARGDIEPLVGREWAVTGENGGTGAGHKVSPAQICWMPGSTITDSKEAILRINGYGVLTAAMH